MENVSLKIDFSAGQANIVSLIGPTGQVSHPLALSRIIAGKRKNCFYSDEQSTSHQKKKLSLIFLKIRKGCRVSMCTIGLDGQGAYHKTGWVNTDGDLEKINRQ